MVYLRDNVLDATFGALADRTRRSILSQLATRDQSIGELAARFDISLPAVSKHVRVLQSAGLAQVRKQGRARQCRIVGVPLRDAAAWIERYRVFWESQLDRLAVYLATTSTKDTPTWQTPAPRSSRSQSRDSSTPRDRASSRRGRRPKP